MFTYNPKAKSKSNSRWGVRLFHHENGCQRHDKRKGWVACAVPPNGYFPCRRATCFPLWKKFGEAADAAINGTK